VLVYSEYHSPVNMDPGHLRNIQNLRQHKLPFPVSFLIICLFSWKHGQELGVVTVGRAFEAGVEWVCCRDDVINLELCKSTGAKRES